MRKILSSYKDQIKNFEDLISSKMPGLFAFNIILMTLILMRSADYFKPFFPLSIHTIVLICFIISIPLLGVRDKMLFFISLLLWFFSGLLKILQIDVWAERTVVYSFEALLIGMILLLISNFKLPYKFKL